MDDVAGHANRHVGRATNTAQTAHNPFLGCLKVDHIDKIEEGLGSALLPDDGLLPPSPPRASTLTATTRSISRRRSSSREARGQLRKSIHTRERTVTYNQLVPDHGKAVHGALLGAVEDCASMNGRK